MEKREQINDYFRSHILGYGFQDLCDFVINKDNCVLCGTCASLCPRINIKKNEPKLLEYDPECSMCFRYCARTYFPEKIFENEIFNGQSRKDFLLGYYQTFTAAKSTNKAVLKVAQNGGVVSTLLIHALNSGLIDGVLLTDRNENWIPKPVVARTPEEILAVAGSKYTIAPTLLTYNNAIYEYKLKNLAFVGMPCQIQAARKLQLYPPLSDEYGKFKLIIGLFCSSNYSYDLINKLVQEDLGIPLSYIKKFDISSGKFVIYTKDELVKEISIKRTKSYNWYSCQYCKDYTAEFADISVGSVGAPTNNWNSLIIRSNVGKKLFDDVVAAEKITVSDKIDISIIKKESLRKKSQITEIDEKMVSAMKLLNVSDIEVKLYATLVCLGDTHISMLIKVMKAQEIEIRKALNKLKRRGWIKSINDYYRPINPTHVIKDEIYKFKKNFEKNIEKIKLEALVKLETLYIQNNYMRVRSEDFMDLIL